LIRSLRFAVGVALVATLAACGDPETPEARDARRSQEAQEIAATPVGPVMINLPGIGPRACVQRSETNLPGQNKEIKGDYRRRLLTPEADAAGVRVYVSTTDVTVFGNVVIHYANKEETCILWTESLTLQEYAIRYGMNPVGVSPYYEPGS
jgi:hypothetical protein